MWLVFILSRKSGFFFVSSVLKSHDGCALGGSIPSIVLNIQWVLSIWKLSSSSRKCSWIISLIIFFALCCHFSFSVCNSYYLDIGLPFKDWPFKDFWTDPLRIFFVVVLVPSAYNAVYIIFEPVSHGIIQWKYLLIAPAFVWLWTWWIQLWVFVLACVEWSGIL